MKLKTLRQLVLILVLMSLAGFSGFWLRDHEIQVKSSLLLRQLADSAGQANLKVPGFQIINREVPSDKKVDFSLFWEVWKRLEEGFIDKGKIDYQKMFYGAVKGMTESLGDPYTVFLPPEEQKRFEEDLNGSFEGVGIELGFNNDKRLSVVAPLKGMPAEAAGIKAGDLILHIKDEAKGLDQETENLNLPEAVEKIRGKRGTKVTLTILHEGENEPKEIEITRQTITVASAEVSFGRIENGKWEEKNSGKVVAHLQLMRFGEKTEKDWEKAVRQIVQIKNEGRLEGVILDVRNNPGGYLTESVNLGSEFLKQGVVVIQQESSGKEKTFSVSRQGKLLEGPLLVLVNKGSASASEILAGSLKVHNRAKLVGEKTYGKGTIQTAEKLKEGASIHITSSRWLLPNSESVDGKGLTPDYEVSLDKEKKEDLQLIKAYEVLTGL